MPKFAKFSLRRYTLPLAALLALGLSLALPRNPLLENALNRLLPSPLDPRVVVIGIDETTLRDYGRLDYWPRQMYASAFDTLHEAGVKAIGLDVLLSSPTPEDVRYAEAFSRPNLVLATLPEEGERPFSMFWQAQAGVSALNVPQANLGVREVQTGYPLAESGALMPSFARQLAVAVGPELPVDTRPHLIRYVRREDMAQRVIPFRDVINGNFRFADVQDKVAVIGVTAASTSGEGLLDIDGRPTPGVLLQARAVSSLLSKPFYRVPGWLLTVLAVTLSTLTVWLRGLWGFHIAALAVAAAFAAWSLGIILPGITLSLSALLGVGLVAFERWWGLRQVRGQTTLVGVGSHLAFTRLLEDRWNKRAQQPLTLVLVDIDQFRRLNEVQGREFGDAVLRALAERILRLRQRGDLVFRWSAGEFAVVLDPGRGRDLAAAIDLYRQHLSELDVQGFTVQTNVGAATSSAQMLQPSELIEQASRERYRIKYLREQAADYKFR